jgi:hypothetical protein
MVLSFRCLNSRLCGPHIFAVTSRYRGFFLLRSSYLGHSIFDIFVKRHSEVIKTFIGDFKVSK